MNTSEGRKFQVAGVGASCVAATGEPRQVHGPQTEAGMPDFALSPVQFRHCEGGNAAEGSGHYWRCINKRMVPQGLVRALDFAPVTTGAA